MIRGSQLAHARIGNCSQSVIGSETAGSCNNGISCTQIKCLSAFLLDFDAENATAQLMFANDFDNACVVEDRNVFFLADFKKSFDVSAASRADRITGAFVKAAVDLINVILEFDAVVFEPLNAFRSFFCELVNQDRIAASVAGS